MGLFDKLKAQFTGQVNKFSGQKDFLEAVCAGAALVAAADGTVEDSEVAAATRAITSNPSLSGAFSTREIEATMEAMMNRAAGGRVGRLGLHRELEDIADDAEKCTVVYATILDVAEGDGEVSTEEKTVLDNVARLLKVDTSQFT